jgi:CBS domain-containing protein
MTRAVITIDAAATIGEVVRTHFGATQSHRAYPVVAEGRLVGVVDRESLGRIEPGDAQAPAARLLEGRRPEFALPGESCRAVASRMAAFGFERLAVVESPESLRLVGIVSRSDLLKVTGTVYEEESRRERFLAWRAS